MPKLKTRKSVAKRFHRTAGGKIRRYRSGRRHLLSGRSRKRKRHLKRPDLVHAAEQERLRQALPWG